MTVHLPEMIQFVPTSAFLITAKLCMSENIDKETYQFCVSVLKDIVHLCLDELMGLMKHYNSESKDLIFIAWFILTAVKTFTPYRTTRG